MLKHRPGYRKYFSKRLLPVVLVLALIAADFVYSQRRDKTPPPQDGQPTAPYINLGPPTEEQKNPARDNPNPPPSQTNPSSGKKTVTPVITSADKSEVRAYVPGIVEDGGTCTATFTHGQDTVNASSKAFSNVSYTSCKPITLNGPLNISGKWTVVVSYSSVTSEGKSEPFTFEVQ